MADTLIQDTTAQTQTEPTTSVAPTLQDRLASLQDSAILLDAKFRDGQWWMRATRLVRPRNDRNIPSETTECIASTFEECVDKLLP